MRAPCAVRCAQGVTLLELVVVLTLLGLVLGVTGLAFELLRAPRESEQFVDLKRARAEAVHSGVPRTAHGVRFLPDGRAIGPGADSLTGEPLAK